MIYFLFFYKLEKFYSSFKTLLKWYPLCINPAHQHIALFHPTLNNWSTNTIVECLMTHVLYFKVLLLIVCIYFSLLKMYSVNVIGLHWQIFVVVVFQEDLPYSAIVSLISSGYHFLDIPQLLKIMNINVLKIEFKLCQNIFNYTAIKITKWCQNIP